MAVSLSDKINRSFRKRINLTQNSFYFMVIDRKLAHFLVSSEQFINEVMILWYLLGSCYAVLENKRRATRATFLSVWFCDKRSPLNNNKHSFFCFFSSKVSHNVCVAHCHPVPRIIIGLKIYERSVISSCQLFTQVPSGESNHVLSEFFTIATWMNHGDEKKDGHKEHLLCNADGDGKVELLLSVITSCSNCSRLRCLPALWFSAR